MWKNDLTNVESDLYHGKTPHSKFLVKLIYILYRCISTMCLPDKYKYDMFIKLFDLFYMS